jgi:hypothetical protein
MVKKKWQFLYLCIIIYNVALFLNRQNTLFFVRRHCIHNARGNFNFFFILVSSGLRQSWIRGWDFLTAPVFEIQILDG